MLCQNLTEVISRIWTNVFIERHMQSAPAQHCDGLKR